MVHDPVSDFITRLRNSSAVRQERIVLPYSKLKHAIAVKLEEKGYVKAIMKRGKKARKVLEIELTYERDGHARIHGAVSVSKPSRRVYMPVSAIRPVRFGKGLLILSTPKGILTGEEARKEHVGGEALFTIW